MNVKFVVLVGLLVANTHSVFSQVTSEQLQIAQNQAETSAEEARVLRSRLVNLEAKISELEEQLMQARRAAAEAADENAQLITVLRKLAPPTAIPPPPDPGEVFVRNLATAVAAREIEEARLHPKPRFTPFIYAKSHDGDWLVTSGERNWRFATKAEALSFIEQTRAAELAAWNANPRGESR